MPTTVAQSEDNECFDVSEPWKGKYPFYIGNTSGAHVKQCVTTRFWWDPAQVEGSVL